MEEQLISKDFDREMTRRALELAAQGVGQVSPGPLVGCVIVNRAGEVVGEGAYIFERTTHAEVIALAAAGEAAKGGTAYISLEPHSHHGRTPPCTEALIKAGIERVVAPINDPNPLVSGIGFEVLREHGITVETGLLLREAEIQNEKFIHWHRQKRPFVHLKAAVSLDGKCATRSGESKWITSESSREKGQLLRHEYDAILVGRGTAEADNPNLTDRTGLKRRKKLIRIVLDSNLSIDPASNLAESAIDFPTIIFCNKDADENKSKVLHAKGVEIIRLPNGCGDLHGILNALSGREIQSVLVEGGPTISGSFVEKGLVDKVTFFVAPILIGGAEAISAVGGEGIERLSEALKLQDLRVDRRDSDLEITGYPARSETDEGE